MMEKASTQQRKFIFVMGTTASGKSEWALQMAEKAQGVIFNCDSVQVYDKVQIGAAKPSAEDLQRRPHHLYGYVKPSNEMTAGIFLRDFYQEVEKIPVETPIFLVGGTGFYFQAIEKGMFEIAPVSDELKMQIVTEMSLPGGPERLYKELSEKDPAATEKIFPKDHYRIGRALELLRSQGGRTLSEIRKEFESQATPFPYLYRKVMPEWPREILSERIFLRTQKMLKAGLIEEVQSLLNEGLESWAPLQSVGYLETIEYLKRIGTSEALTREELTNLIATKTRQLAKRQRTWFQRDAETLRFQPGSLEDKVCAEKILHFLEGE